MEREEVGLWGIKFSQTCDQMPKVHDLTPLPPPKKTSPLNPIEEPHPCSISRFQSGNMVPAFIWQWLHDLFTYFRAFQKIFQNILTPLCCICNGRPRSVGARIKRGCFQHPPDIHHKCKVYNWKQPDFPMRLYFMSYLYQGHSLLTQS